MQNYGPVKVNWWYESIVDWMLMNPDKTKGDCAKFFNVSKIWMYSITHSDVFKALYEERRKKHSAMVSSTVIEKTAALTEMAVEKLAERVAETGDQMTPGFLKDVAEMGLEKLGYTGKQSAAPVLQPAAPQVNITVVNAQALADARARMEQKGRDLARGAIPAPAGSLIDLTKDRTSITPLEAIIIHEEIKGEDAS